MRMKARFDVIKNISYGYKECKKCMKLRAKYNIINMIKKKFINLV